MLSARAARQVRKNYVTSHHITAFSGPGNIKRSLGRYKESEIGKALRSVDTYTLHREFHKPRYKNPFYIYKKRQQIQLDLIDVSEMKNHNDGVTFILVAIDCFSKYVWVKPMVNKSGAETLAALKHVLQAIKNMNMLNGVTSQKPSELFCDSGKEFVNRQVKDYLQQEGIKITHASSEMKAAIVERVNRTLQDLIYRYMTENQTYRYVNALPDLIYVYNMRGHRSLKFMSPRDAERDVNQQAVLNALNERYTKIGKQRKNPKYDVGQRVRINKLGGRFARGYHERFSQELFEIVEVLTRMPIPMYILKSLNDNQIIKGGFYDEELQPVEGDVFKIEKVLKERTVRGQRQLFVKWIGFDNTHNSWIDATNVTRRY